MKHQIVLLLHASASTPELNQGTLTQDHMIKTGWIDEKYVCFEFMVYNACKMWELG